MLRNPTTNKISFWLSLVTVKTVFQVWRDCWPPWASGNQRKPPPWNRNVEKYPNRKKRMHRSQQNRVTSPCNNWVHREDRSPNWGKWSPREDQGPSQVMRSKETLASRPLKPGNPWNNTDLEKTTFIPTLRNEQPSSTEISIFPRHRRGTFEDFVENVVLRGVGDRGCIQRKKPTLSFCKGRKQDMTSQYFKPRPERNGHRCANAGAD